MSALDAKTSVSQKPTTVVEGNFYNCPEGLVVTADCIGGAYRTKIAGHPVTILLPAVDPNHDGDSLPELSAPAKDYVYPVHPGSDPWGMVISADPSGWQQALILRLAFRFEAAGSEAEVAKICGEIEAGLKSWWPNLELWLDMYSDLDLLDHDSRQRSTRIQRVALSADIGDQPGDTARRLTWRRPTEVIRIPAEVEVPDPAVLERCFRLAGGNSNPPQGWLYLREARSWFRAGEYRRAVIDACTGAEIALSQQVREKATADDLVIEQLLLQCKGIVEIAKVLKRIAGVTVSPSAIDDGLAKVRNLAVHTGEEPDEKTAAKALTLATKVVESAWPQATLDPDA